MNRKSLWVIVGALLLAGTMQAQETKIYAGPTAPRGAFKDYASSGWNVGVKTGFKMRTHLSLIASVDLFYNRLTPYTDDLRLSTSNFTIASTPVCYNVPLMVHAKYTTKFSEKRKQTKDLDFWAEGAIGVNRRTMSQCSYSSVSFDALTGASCATNTTLSFDAKTTFAHQWGVGVTYKNRISVALVWYNLGRAKLSGTQTVSQVTADSNITQTTPFENGRLREKLRTFRIGYTF